jgi:hypothetical protein
MGHVIKGVDSIPLYRREKRMTKGTARVTTHLLPEDRDRLKHLAERHDRTVAAELRRALGCYFEVAEGPVWTPHSKN